jgi:hypothetical protein
MPLERSHGFETDNEWSLPEDCGKIPSSAAPSLILLELGRSRSGALSNCVPHLCFSAAS